MRASQPKSSEGLKKNETRGQHPPEVAWGGISDVTDQRHLEKRLGIGIYPSSRLRYTLSSVRFTILHSEENPIGFLQKRAGFECHSDRPHRELAVPTRPHIISVT